MRHAVPHILPLRRFKVKDRSMEPRIREGDCVVVARFAYRIGKPRKGDIVVVRSPDEDKFLLKRVVETEAGRYIVAGDNKEYSVDSRKFGPISKDSIIGKVIFHYR